LKMRFLAINMNAPITYDPHSKVFRPVFSVIYTSKNVLITDPNPYEGETVVKWVTREFVHVDRTACPWLIKRFVDPEAEFIFVPAEKINEVVRKEKAIPYDAPDVELGHHGDKCSFDAIVEKYKIKDPAVLALADIVRAADIDKPETAPESAGLDAVMTGISIIAKNDHEAIEKASPVYDAFYVNCKLKLIRERYEDEIEKMDRKKRREFLKRKLNE
jgi:hypothetical protein